MVGLLIFFFSSRRRHTRCSRDWSSDVCSSDLGSAPSLILSNSAWRSTFGASAEIIGKQVKAHQDIYTVVGVLPGDFVFVENPVDAFIPLQRRSEEHTSELQSRLHLVCRLLLEKKKNN